MAEKYNKLVTSTKFSFLDASQRREFQSKWYALDSMVSKWRGPAKPGDVHEVFGNKKRLEKEIEDLEDLSLAAYRAMKLLRKQIEMSSRDEYDSANNEMFMQPRVICTQCNLDVTNEPSWCQVYGKYFCNSHCLSEFEQAFESENYSA